MNRIASITPSGYAGFKTRIKIASKPPRNPYTNFPFAV